MERRQRETWFVICQVDVIAASCHLDCKVIIDLKCLKKITTSFLICYCDFLPKWNMQKRVRWTYPGQFQKRGRESEKCRSVFSFITVITVSLLHNRNNEHPVGVLQYHVVEKHNTVEKYNTEVLPMYRFRLSPYFVKNIFWFDLDEPWARVKCWLNKTNLDKYVQ